MIQTVRIFVLGLAALSAVSLAAPNTGGGPKQNCQWVTTTMPKVTGWDKYGFPTIVMVTTQIYVCRPA
jgi:hypothetical protein